MANMPNVLKTKVSLQLDNEVIVALDKKAEDDGTSRNAVANYYLSHELQRIIKSFTKKENDKLAAMERKNKEARNAR